MRSGTSLSVLALGAALCLTGPLAAPLAAQSAETAPETAIAPTQDVEPKGELSPQDLPEGDIQASFEFEGIYQPTDELERSLWLQMDEYERTLKTSKQVIRNSSLNAYVRGVLCRTVGPECANIRLYIMRSPYFNATMAPNGMMTVWSGLLLRTQNEAQLAAVLGHEYSHFKRRHSLKMFRKAKSKTNTAGWLSFVPILGPIAGLGLIDSIYKFSRTQEEEADLDGVDMLHSAGYDAMEVPRIWAQLLDERDATMLARFGKIKKRKTKAGLFATHPPSQARVDYLTVRVTALEGPRGETGVERYQSAMRAWWPQFLDDQIKMNDTGGTNFLIEAMGEANGWTPWITFARAEYHRKRGGEGDFEAALSHYTDAIDRGGDLAELWRGRGYTLRKLGRKDEAKSDFREYLKRVPDAPDRAMVTMLAGGPL
ncbi:MAG: M48 family metallopeptidase [Pseudomonadota bacterium]